MVRTGDPDFRVIKAHVSILDVCARKGIELRGNQHQKTGKCPLPMHSTEERDTFKVGWSSQSKQWVWSCHSSSCVAARGGKKKGGDLIDFVALLEKIKPRDAGILLTQWFGPFPGEVTGNSDPSPRPAPALSEDAFGREKVNLPLAFELRDIQHVHPYLTARGFEEEECEYLGVGFFPGKGTMAGRIVFPVHDDTSGKLIAYVGRVIDGTLISEQNPRWKFPSGFFKSITLYNLNRVEGDEVIVCESFWGVLACVRAGIFNTVACMGTTVSDVQAEILAQRFRKVTLLLDGDEYGREAVPKAIEKLVAAEVEEIEPVLLPKGLSPDELSPDDLRRILKLPNVIYRWSATEEFEPVSA